MTLDGNLIASGHFDGALRFWDVRSGREARTIRGLHEQQICSVAVGLLGGECCGTSNGFSIDRTSMSVPPRSYGDPRSGNTG